VLLFLLFFFVYPALLILFLRLIKLILLRYTLNYSGILLACNF